MVGRYPFVEPSGRVDRAAGERQILALVEAGITTFAQLNGELPPQGDAFPLGGVEGEYTGKDGRWMGRES